MFGIAFIDNNHKFTLILPMRKTLISLLSILFSCFFVSAQTHYVIALDCTKSMDHPNAFYDNDYSADARDVTKIWEPAKNTVKDIFDSASSNDRFTIILFQDRVLDCVDADKSQLTWSSINARMEAAINNGGNTCILSAWERAEKYFSNSSNAVFYLITDGVEDHGKNDKETPNIHTEQLCEKIKTFCATYANTDAFYTNLVKSLHDKNNNAITKALEASPCFRTKVGGRFDDRLVIDIDENKGNYTQTVSLTFHPTDEVPANLNNILISSNDPYFEITPASRKIENNRFDIIIKCKELLPASVHNGNAYSFPIKVFSDSNEKHQIYEQTINIYANFNLSKVAYFPNQRLEGESVYQKPFKILEGVFPKIAAEKKPNVIRFDLNELVTIEGQPSMFNAEARRVGAHVCLKLSDKKGKNLPLIKVYYNGRLCDDSVVISSSDSQSVIEIEFDKNAQQKKYSNLNFVVQSVDKVDRINSLSHVNEYKLELDLTYRVKENPWYVTAICIIILIGLLILLIIVLSQLIRPSIKGIIYLYIDEVAIAPVRFKYRPFNLGYKWCVICSPGHKQSNFWGLFVGYKKFVIVPDLNSPIILQAIGRRKLLAYNNGDTNNIAHIGHGQTVSLGNIRITYTANNY